MEKLVPWKDVEDVLNFRISVLKAKQDYDQAMCLESDLNFLAKKVVDKSEKRSNKNEYTCSIYFK